MNYRTIEPVEFWSPTGTNSATRILLYNFHGYNFDGTDSYVSYKLLAVTVVTDTDEEGNEVERDVTKSLSEGSVGVPDEVVQVWGVDDEPIFDYVIDQLNLEKV
jgi:hypothetical protein